MKKKDKVSKINTKQIIINYILFIFVFIIGILFTMNKTLYEEKQDNTYKYKKIKKKNNTDRRSIMSNSIKKAFEK